MKPRNIMVPVLVALAAGTFAGCGDDEESPQAAQNTTPAPASDTPEASWAQKLCMGVAGKVTTVQPPNVDTGKPAEVKAGLITFFTDISSQLEGQIEAVEAVGPPPGDEAAADWKKAVKRMKAVNKDISKVRREVRGTDVSSKSDLDAVIADLGKSMGKLTEYQGPVAELGESETIQRAITEEPTCAQVS